MPAPSYSWRRAVLDGLACLLFIVGAFVALVVITAAVWP